MSRFILVITIFLSCSTNDGQKFSWDRIETKISREEKRAVLSQIENNITKSYDQQATELSDLGIFDLFHFVDINGDAKDDIIFNGYGGAADEYMMVFIDSGNDFHQILHDYGHIDYIVIDSTTTMASTRKIGVGEEGSDSTFQYKMVDGKFRITSRAAIKR